MKFLFKFFNKNIFAIKANWLFLLLKSRSIHHFYFHIGFHTWVISIFCISPARKVLANNLTPSTFSLPLSCSFPSSIRNEFSSSFHIFLGVFFHFIFLTRHSAIHISYSMQKIAFLNLIHKGGRENDFFPSDLKSLASLKVHAWYEIMVGVWPSTWKISFKFHGLKKKF